MRTLLFIIICLGIAFKINAQERPFPQNVDYEFGVQSNIISTQDVTNAYKLWKSRFVRKCGENEVRIIKNDSTITVSEGIAYGLLITAYIADKEVFDKLLNYYTARLNNHGMMNWIYKECETGDNEKNGATDADLDAAMALIVATFQWPNEPRYKTEASKLIDSLEKFNFTVCNGIIVQKPGDGFGGCTCTNPSYFAPAYYKAFGMFKKNEGNANAMNFWFQAANDSYVTLLKNANKYTGLVYAWTNAEGGDPQDCYYSVSGSGVYNSYQYDACRTPWRITTDYIWWGDVRAKTWTQKITQFVQYPVYKQTAENGDVWYGAGGIENVVDNYWPNGLRRINPDAPDWGHRHSIPFVGSFALSSMSSDQQTVDNCMKEYKKVTPNSYYESCLGVIYMLTASGNFWNPYYH